MTSPQPSCSLPPRVWWLLAAAICCLFIPTLFHPLGPDQSLFNLNSLMLLKGHVYYRDMVDMKPPLISFLYAAANLLFPAGEHSMRILDLLLQGATCWLIIAVVRRAGGDDRFAALSALCYALLYNAQRYSDTLQSESYVGLFGLAMVWLILGKATFPRFLLIGIMGGMLWLLKFPFAILLLLAPLTERMLFGRNARAIIAHTLVMGIGFGIIAGAFLLYLITTGAWDDFLLVSNFMRGYAMTELQSPGQWLLNLVTVLPYHLAADFSPLLLFMIIMGFRQAWHGRADHESFMEPGRINLRICTIVFIMMLGTIILEGKYPNYHFVRLFPFGAILAGCGMLCLAGTIGNRWRMGTSWKIAIIAVALAAGPLAAYGWRTILPVASQLLHAGTPAQFARYDFPVHETGEIGQRIRSERRPGDEMFVAASIPGRIYYQSGLWPMTPVYHFAFVSDAYGARQWSDSVRSYLLSSRPRFIVAELTDSYPSLTGSTLTSHERLRQLPGIDSLLSTWYAEEMRTEHLVMYRRGQ